DGIAGALFADQALTVTFALLASLIVAMTSIPMLASRQGFQGQAEVEMPATMTPPTTRWGKLRYYSAKIFGWPFYLLFKLL
ncbi:hypothetical protein L9G16_23455, partial [Shewanella sp. A25]|nr:hypothetical protein [Shewanella shenzhenensis]